MSGLTLDTKAGVLRGGKSGVPAVVPGKPDDSLIVAAVKHTANGLSMPPGKTLNRPRSMLSWNGSRWARRILEPKPLRRLLQLRLGQGAQTLGVPAG